jgi:hypothetical protein
VRPAPATSNGLAAFGVHRATGSPDHRARA